MKKAIFTYKKTDGSTSQRVVFKPTMLKESSNYLKEFNNPDVNYLHGYELDKSNLNSTTISQYEKLIDDYYNIKFPTLEEFIEQNGLDSKKIKHKSFKKEGIENLQLL